MALLPRPPAAASLVVDLARIVGAHAVSTRDADRFAYSRDCWPRDLICLQAGKVGAAPSCVVWPETPGEVARVLELAERVGVPVVPFGAGSGVAGGARATEGGIVLDVKRMRAIRTLDERNLSAEVEAGIIGERLERLLEARGYTLGHFPSSIGCSTLGGWLAARSAGQMSTAYGKIEDMVLGLEVAAAGRVRRSHPGPRSIAGLDFIDLVLGSEGTLGVITSAALRIRPLPLGRSFRGYRFPNVVAGIEAIRRILRCNIRPAVVRLYDALDTLMGRGHGKDEDETDDLAWFDDLARRARSMTDEVARRVPFGGMRGVRNALVRGTVRAVMGAPLVLNRALAALPEECLLIVGFEGQPAIIAAEFDEAHRIAMLEGAVDLGAAPGEHWYANRYNVSFKQSKIYESGLFVDTMEVAATWDRLPSLYKLVRRAISRDAIVLAHFSHAYPEGCSIYFTFSGASAGRGEPKSALERYDRIWKNALVAVHEAGGTISHHHGVGELKSAGMAREHGPGGMRFLSSLRRACDPLGIMNPGKLGLAPSVRPAPARARSQIGRRRGGVPAEIVLAVGAQNVVHTGNRTLVRPPDESALSAVLRTAETQGLALASDQIDYRLPLGALRIDLARFEGITRLSEHSLFVEVEAGVRIERLEEMLGAHQLTLGTLHPRASRRSVGAAVARNILVRRGIAFGDLDDLCFSIRCLLPNGTPIETRPVPRSAAGPDVDRAFVGARGRFGIITRATLRVVKKTEHRPTLAYAFSTFRAAIECARGVLRGGLRPSAGRVVPTSNGGVASFDFDAATSAIAGAQTTIASSIAVHEGGERIDGSLVAASGGRFDLVVEATCGWTSAEDVTAAMVAASRGEVWIDFLAPEGVTIVARVLDGPTRNATLRAARECGATVSTNDVVVGDWSDVGARLSASLDPTGVFRPRDRLRGLP